MKTNAIILVIEDDAVVRHFLKSALAQENYKIIEAVTGAEGLSKAAACTPDVILLDLGLPDMDGTEVATQLRSWTQKPIIVLSSREQESSKVMALDAGADDYLTKPIGVAELQARIRVALRLSRRSLTAVSDEKPVYKFDNLKVDLMRHRVTLDGKALRLTPIEYKLLAHLIKNAGRVVKHRELLQTVWGEEYGTEVNYLRIYIKHLRNKIEEDSANPRFILSEVGIGYRFAGE